MTHDVPPHARNLSTPYKPVAAYYEDADSVEYVRRDAPAVYQRVDAFLTLIFDMKNRDELIGFRLKGFKNFYLNHLSHLDFVALVSPLEQALTVAADSAFDFHDRREAYDRARLIAIEDRVTLRDLPKAKAS